MRYARNKILIIVFVLFVFIANTPFLFAEMMSSNNYKIQSDSANFGGELSNSPSYSIEDTMGEIATGPSSSANYNLKAGYQQMQEVALAMTAAANVVMSPSLGGLTGGTSNGSTATTITTDDPAGYQLLIKASSTPAMQGEAYGGTIADYVTAGADPDFTFSVPATAGEFGFSPEGTDIAAKYKDNGSVCNTGSSDTVNACWDALSTSNKIIDSRTSANSPSGITTTIKFEITLGSSHVQVADTYTATSTITALAL